MKKILAMLLAVLMALAMTGLAETVGAAEAEDEVFEAVEDGTAGDEAFEAAEDGTAGDESFEADEDAAETPAEPEALKSALIAGLYNIVLNSTDAEGNVNTTALEDLELNLVVDTTDALQLVASAYRGDENLAFAVARLVGERIQFTMTGSERTFEVNPSQLEGQDTSGVAEIVRMVLPSLIGGQLPQIPVSALPKLNLGAPLLSYATGTTEAGGVTTTTFEISEAETRVLIERANAAFKDAASRAPQLERFTGLLDQVLKSGMKISIGGTIEDSLVRQSVSIGLYLAGEGEEPEAPTFYLNADSALNALTLAFELPSETGNFTAAQLTLNTDDVANALSFNLNAIGLVNVDAGVQRAEGLQNVTLSGNVGQTNAALALQYGVVDGLEHVSVSGSMTGMGEFLCTADGMKNDDGSFAGMMDWNFSNADVSTNITMDFYELLDDYDMGGYAMPTRIVSADEITQEELTAAFQPMLDYLTPVLGLTPAEEAEAPTDAEADAEVEPAA